MNKKIFFFVFMAPVLAITMALFQAYYLLNISEYKGDDKVFIIKNGEAFSKINYRLKQEKLISSSKVFHRYAQFNDLITKFKSGHFLIKKNSTMLEVIETLVKGKSLGIKITIPEGKNLFEIAEILDSKKVIEKDEFIKLAKSPEFVQAQGIDATRIEGYLYPDTYFFTPDMQAKQVLSKMVSVFNAKTKSIDFKKSNLSKSAVITLASIVEKETGASFERPKIAGVFLNRLKKKMRLQSDPTTIYGIYENFNGNLRKRHLQEKTPYNTYKISALPVGPISNPGLESIKAVLNPEKHSYLYFVSQNDGTHIFSTKYSDHINAVNKFQKNQRNRSGKSWRDLKKKK